MTLSLLWSEYCDAAVSRGEEPYMYSAFCRERRAWAQAHVSMFAVVGGAAPVLVPDNCKTAVSKNAKEALVVNERYRRMSGHYGCAVVPARARRPRDKASVEMGVGLIERQAMLPLRSRRFMSLEELNAALADQDTAINSRPFQRRDGSRESIFLAQEKPLLIPLPATPYEMTARKELTVDFNCRVRFDGTWYSVPFEFVKRAVAVAATARTVSVMADGGRIAIHGRARRRGEYRTNPDHMPDAHRDYAEWNGERFRSWAAAVGDATAEAIGAILASRKIEQQSYRSCRAVLALERAYGGDLLEEACQKALLRTSRPSCKTVKGTISALSREAGRADESAGAYLRGQDCCRRIEGDCRGAEGGRTTMASQSTMGKLRDMRLSVMAGAYRDQEEVPPAGEMSFDERLAMMADAEWDSRRTNKRLRCLRQANFPEHDANIADVRYDDDRGLDRAQMLELSNCSQIASRRNVIITGASGAGKTWISNALGVAACNAFYTVRCTRLPELLDELTVFKGEEWLKQRKKHDTYRRSGVHAQADDGPRLEGKPMKTGGAVCPSLLSTMRGTAIAGAHSVYRRRVEQPPPRRTVRTWLYPS